VVSVREALQSLQNVVIVGWREWVSLPELGIDLLEAKIDTGARTSALHVEDLEAYADATGRRMVRFRRTRGAPVIEVEAIDHRGVKSSGGQVQERYVIRTLLCLAHHARRVEITLTNRATMKYDMLVGRSTLGDRFLVQASESYLTGKPVTTF